jgi:general secretion pathway protein E
MPLAQSNGTLVVAMSDPVDYYAIQGLQVATGFAIEARLARERDILEALEQAYGGAAGGDGSGTGGDGDTEVAFVGEDEEDVNHLRDLASEAPVIRLVNMLINRAVESRASDIHIEPFEEQLKVRYRIDGVLHDVETPPRRLQAAIVSRIKIMAKLNIAERRLPQDGRIKLRMMGKEIDLRVSTLPTLYGESVVLRILDRSSIVVNLESLGFPEDTLKEFEAVIQRPYGLILVTGPTGSGKTTTLYTALAQANDEGRKVITFEDPIEYQLEGTVQIQVREQIGLTFASGLRSVLRHDPDVVLVGEIRDFETAEIAVRAAQTGHLVLSTLHTNDSISAVTRLLEMRIEAYLIASSLVCSISQRLARRICRHCAEPDQNIPGAIREEMSSVLKLALDQVRAWKGLGCVECNQKGHRGRVAIYEFFLVSELIADRIQPALKTGELRAEARKLGWKSLREMAWLKVQRGLIPISEQERWTRQIDAAALAGSRSPRGKQRRCQFGPPVLRST